MVTFRPVVYVNGILLTILGLTMLAPAMVDLYDHSSDWRVFVASSAVTILAGLAMFLGAHPRERFDLNLRQAFMLTTSVWVLVAGFGALPFMFSAYHVPVVDAYFESMSGLTTTGATVLTGLDTMPRGLLLWRALLNGLGGMGIIVMAVALLPLLRIGGMQLFRMESSDKTDKVQPRTAAVAGGVCAAYGVLTVLCTVLLWLAGMTPFEAIAHAMPAISTGGFSTSDASAGHWNSPLIHWILTTFMIAGSLPFVLYTNPVRDGRIALLYDSQVRWFLGFLVGVSVFLGVWRSVTGDVSLFSALTHAFFNVSSVMSTTGFASEDYGGWGQFAWIIFLFLTFVGGCTGSTSGGIKIFRWEVLFKMAHINLKRLLYPRGVFPVDFNRNRISDAVVESVLGFVILYGLSFAVFWVLLSLCGLDFTTAMSASATAISNVGPGLGEIIGPSGNFQSLPATAKALLSLEMMLGRLELMAVFVLCTRAYWRH